jgi:hypothetical protein
MAIGPDQKTTTTGLIDKKPMIPRAADLSALQGTQQVQSTQAQVTPPSLEQTDQPQFTEVEQEIMRRTETLTDEDKETFKSVLSPSVRIAFEKLLPEFKEMMDQFGSNEPNVIFPLSIVKRFAVQRYGGESEEEAVQNFMADVIGPDLMQAQMGNQNNVPPGTEQPTETAGLVEPTGETGLMSSPQNMETV